MNRIYLLFSAFLADQLAGDPEWFPHPVRLIGTLITYSERVLRRPGDSSRRELITGTGLTGALVLTTYLMSRSAISRTYRHSRRLGAFTEIVLAWTCLASRNLQQEAASVMTALASNNLPVARVRLARIVGRDTATLDSSEISRALIETLAESVSDGVIAPIIYMATGGVPLAMTYKAINTLDSMIGHRDERYLYFGRASARLDDLVNYLPARLSALGIIVLSRHPRSAWRTWLYDGNKHSSPNAGQPEAAMAGALRTRLGGSNSYAGELVSCEHLGATFSQPTPLKARHAMAVTAAAAWLGLATGVVIAALCQSSKAKSCT